MIAAVEKAGVRMMVDFTLHFDPTYLAAYERIQAGEIGDVLTMFARRNGTQSSGYPGQPVPYSEWTDILISTGIHELELMTWYADAPVVRVYGESVNLADRSAVGDDGYMALLRFESGAIGSLESTALLPVTEPAGISSRFDIVGSRGCIYIEHINSTLFICNEERCYHPDITLWPVLSGQAKGTLRESMRHFLTCLLEDKEPSVGAVEGRLALQLVLAIQESCRRETPVDL